MSVDTREMEAFGRALSALKDDIPRIMNQLVVAEGVYAVGEARKIAKNEPGMLNTGAYRWSFHAGDKVLRHDMGHKEHDGSAPRQRGKTYTIDVYNNIEYAGYLEYGFRSHWVPGYWEGKTFVYQPGAPGGMYVGHKDSWVNGHFTLRRAIRRTKTTQNARLQRKLNQILNDRLGKGWRKYL